MAGVGTLGSCGCVNSEECRRGLTTQVSRSPLPVLNRWALRMEARTLTAEIQDLLAKLKLWCFPGQSSHHSVGQAQGTRRLVTMSLSGCTRQDFPSGWPPAGHSTPWCHRNGTFPWVCPTALPSVPLLSSPFLPPPSSFVYLLRTLTHESNQVLCCSFLHILVTYHHLQNAWSVFVAGLGLMAEHRLHVVGAELQHPQVTPGLRPSFPGRLLLVFPKDFLPCYSSFMAAVHRAAEHAGVSVANMLTGCFAGPGSPSPQRLPLLSVSIRVLNTPWSQDHPRYTEGER